MTTANLILTFIVVGFWTAILINVRRRTRVVSLNLLVMPLAFEMLGVFLNVYRLWWGTCGVLCIHVPLPFMMLSRPAKKNRRRAAIHLCS